MFLNLIILLIGRFEGGFVFIFSRFEGIGGFSGKICRLFEWRWIFCSLHLVSKLFHSSLSQLWTEDMYEHRKIGQVSRPLVGYYVQADSLCPSQDWRLVLVYVLKGAS